jgi:hypothetical protein
VVPAPLPLAEELAAAGGEFELRRRRLPLAMIGFAVLAIAIGVGVGVVGSGGGGDSGDGAMSAASPAASSPAKGVEEPAGSVAVAAEPAAEGEDGRKPHGAEEATDPEPAPKEGTRPALLAPTEPPPSGPPPGEPPPGEPPPRQQPPKQEPPKQQPPTPPARVGKGEIRVHATPSCTVFLDGARRGETPIVLRDVAEGRRRVRLVNPRFGIDETHTIPVGDGEVVKKRYSFPIDPVED